MCERHHCYSHDYYACVNTAQHQSKRAANPEEANWSTLHNHLMMLKKQSAPGSSAPAALSSRVVVGSLEYYFNSLTLPTPDGIQDSANPKRKSTQHNTKNSTRDRERVCLIVFVLYCGI